jgi:hypothetical protein
MKKIGIAQGVPEGLVEALASRYQGEVEQVISTNQNIGYEFVVACDDLPVPPGVPIRRYVGMVCSSCSAFTPGSIEERDSVAYRRSFARGVQKKLLARCCYGRRA